MDEPTAFLDLPARYGIVSLLRRLTREKGSVSYIPRMTWIRQSMRQTGYGS
ncbi:MAG: hypothetical protein R2756_15805 [Bacteroidales bacterium]